MTRFWMRNLTSRNDSRTGAWLVSRLVVGALGGPPAVGGSPLGMTGAEPGAPALPGRALSIRFRRDIAYTPFRPEGPTVIAVIAMRTAISSGLTWTCRRPGSRTVLGPGSSRDGGCPA